jgi:hypothetical protein
MTTMGDHAMTGDLVANRGRGSGIVLMLLGAWGAVVPFIGPYLSYGYSPDKAWQYTSGRLWLSIMPGAVAFLGGLLVVSSRSTAVVGGLLAALAGVWFVLGQQIIALAVTSGSISAGTPLVTAGAPVSAATMRFLDALGFFYGLGLVIAFFAALAIGRASAQMTAAAYQSEADTFIGEGQYGPTY